MAVNDPEKQLRAAQAAKAKLSLLLANNRRVRGIGITRLGGRYAVRLNLSGSAQRRVNVPDEVDGVPIAIEFVGEIVPFSGLAGLG